MQGYIKRQSGQRNATLNEQAFPLYRLGRWHCRHGAWKQHSKHQRWQPGAGTEIKATLRSAEGGGGRSKAPKGRRNEQWGEREAEAGEAGEKR